MPVNILHASFFQTFNQLLKGVLCIAKKKGGGSARSQHSARCASKWRRPGWGRFRDHAQPHHKICIFSNVAPKILEKAENAHKKKSDPKSPAAGLPWRCGGRLGVQMSAQGEYEPQTGQKTSTASKATFSICLMRTKVVASSPICKS